MVIESFINFFNRILFFTAFVNNATGFPKPLSSEEEAKYVKLFQSGDLKARDVLIEHNLRLVAHIVKKYSTAGEADDLISVGTIGLIKGINTYRLDKGSQLSTYVARCIENEILMLLRLNKKHNQVYSLQECLGKDKDGNEITMADILSNETEDLSSLVETTILTKELVKLIKKVLPEREYEIICMRYGVNKTPALTQREVAKKLGISRSYISRLENKALKVIKDELKKNKLMDLWIFIHSFSIDILFLLSYIIV